MNKQGLMSGSTDTPLSREGRAQAKIAGQHAKDKEIDLIVSSPLMRAYDTAKIIAKEIGYKESKIVINNLTVERHFGQLEGKPWSPDLELEGVEDIETDDSILERAHLVHQWLDTLDAENILIVSHGTFGRALRSFIRPEEFNMASHQGLNNAELVCWL